MTYEEELKARIRASEERFIDYKKRLEGIHKDKGTYPPDDPFVIWLKDETRAAKNQEEKYLKDLIEEKTCYPGMTSSSIERFLTEHKIKSHIRSLRASLSKALEIDRIGESHETIKQLLSELDKHGE